MNQDSLLKKIEKLINPIRVDVSTLKGGMTSFEGSMSTLTKDVSSFKKDMGGLKGDVSTLKGDVSTLKGDLKAVKRIQNKQAKDIGTIKETLESHTSSLVNIETTINVYADMYKINDDNVRKIEKRTETLEEKAGIEAPEELTLLKVQ